MTITGLENDYYLVNNPIYVTVTVEIDLPGTLQLAIGSRGLIIRMDHEVVVVIDIAPIVKTLMNVPDFNNPNENITTINISGQFFNEITGEQLNLGAKSFIRGGLYTGNNNHLSNNAVLKVAEYIPVWENYPAKKYVISGTQIVAQDILITESEIMREHSCEGAYLKFKNSKGGYSHYLFNTYTFGNSTNKMESIDVFGSTQNNFYQLGGGANKELTVEARFGKRHFQLLMDLVESPEVWVYQFHKIINSDFIATPLNDWTKLINPGNSISIESGDEAIDVSLKFELRLTKDNRLNG